MLAPRYTSTHALQPLSLNLHALPGVFRRALALRVGRTPGTCEEMSAEATDYVWVNPRIGGSRFLILLALAHESKDRRPPFSCSIGYAEIAWKLSVNRMSARSLILEMMEDGQITRISTGTGNGKSTYRF